MPDHAENGIRTFPVIIQGGDTRLAALGRAGDEFVLVLAQDAARKEESDSGNGILTSLSVLVSEDPFPGLTMDGRQMIWVHESPLLSRLSRRTLTSRFSHRSRTTRRMQACWSSSNRRGSCDRAFPGPLPLPHSICLTWLSSQNRLDDPARTRAITNGGRRPRRERDGASLCARRLRKVRVGRNRSPLQALQLVQTAVLRACIVWLPSRCASLTLAITHSARQRWARLPPGCSRRPTPVFRARGLTPPSSYSISTRIGHATRRTART